MRITTNLFWAIPRMTARPVLPALLFGGLLLSCATARAQDGQIASSSTPPAGATASSTLLLGPGDLIEVQVFDTPEVSGKVRVDQRGVVNLPVGGEVDVKGLNAVQAAAAISERLKTAQVMIDPHVSVFVDEYATQGITILGEVRTPGTYTLYGPHSVYDLLAAAGGPSTAEGDTINITHHGDADHPLLIPVHSPNYSELLKTTMVVPGDMVVISRAPLYYVIGDVGHPGAYYINNGDTVTLLNAIALASGVNRTAAYSKATIIRKTPDGTVKIPLDIKQVLENKGSNVTLQAQDVLVVPHSGFKTFLDTALPAITNAGISAGASAAIIR